MPETPISIESDVIIDVDPRLRAEEHEPKPGGASGHIEPVIDERTVISPTVSEPSDLISRENEHEHDELQSRQVNDVHQQHVPSAPFPERSECSPVAEPGSPLLQQSKNRAATGVDQSSTRRSTASLTSSHAQGLDLVYAKLRYIAELRSRALDSRSLAKEKGAHLGNILSKLIKETRGLLQILKTRASVSAQDEPRSVPVEAFADWEDFDELEELMKEVDDAGREFDTEVGKSIDLDWVLCELEKDVYTDYRREDASPSTTAAIAKRIGNALGTDPGMDNAAFPPKSPLEADDPPVAVPEAHQPQSPVQDHGMFYSDYDGDEGPPLLTTADGDEDVPEVYDYISVPETNSDFFAPGAPHGDEDNLFEGVLSGSQFMDVDLTKSMTGSPEATFPMQLLKQSSFTADELEEFTEWLLAETPWIVGNTQKRDQLLAAVSNVNFLRAWIWHSLGSLCAGRLPLPKHSDERQLAVSHTSDFFKQWFRNPFVAADVRLPDPETEEVDDEEVEQAQLASVGEPSVLDVQEYPPSINEPPSPPLSDQAAESDPRCLTIPPMPLPSLLHTPPAERRRSSTSDALIHVQIANMDSNLQSPHQFRGLGQAPSPNLDPFIITCIFKHFSPI